MTNPVTRGIQLEHPIIFRKSFPRRNPRLVDTIEHGDRVAIVDRFGKKHAGRAVMRSSDGGWVLNMGGRYGTPALADDRNIISVKKGRRNPKDILNLGDTVYGRVEDTAAFPTKRMGESIKGTIIGKTKSTVDVCWYNGLKEYGIPIEYFFRSNPGEAWHNKNRGYWLKRSASAKTDMDEVSSYARYEQEGYNAEKSRELGLPNPNLKEALEAVKRAHADTKAGHTDAVEFWKGYASGALVSNPKVASVKDIPNEILVDGIKYSIYKETDTLESARGTVKWITDVKHPPKTRIAQYTDISTGTIHYIVYFVSIFKNPLLPELGARTLHRKGYCDRCGEKLGNEEIAEVTDKDGRLMIIHAGCYRKTDTIANPILPELGAGLVAGIGLGAGFKAVDMGAKFIEKKLGMRRKTK